MDNACHYLGTRVAGINMATLTRGIKLNELASMSEGEKNRRIGEMFQAATNPTQEQLNQQKTDINNQIQAFESRYKMASSEMKQLLVSGKIKETAEFCSWLMLLKIRGRFENRGSSQPYPL